MLKNLQKIQLKLLQIEQLKVATADLIGNKIEDKITNVSRTSPQNN